MLGGDPAPVAADLSVGVEAESDEAYEKLSVVACPDHAMGDIGSLRRNSLVMKPGIHAARQIRMLIVVVDRPTMLLLITVHSTTMAMIRMFQSTAETVIWFTQALAMQPASMTSLCPFLRTMAPEMVLLRLFAQSANHPLAFPIDAGHLRCQRMESYLLSKD